MIGLKPALYQTIETLGDEDPETLIVRSRAPASGATSENVIPPAPTWLRERRASRLRVLHRWNGGSLDLPFDLMGFRNADRH
jgi:hypothetical protein